ncbi:MAG: M20/M25/M40 family metallo-hydrolase [Planctomycetota bacterium]
MRTLPAVLAVLWCSACHREPDPLPEPEESVQSRLEAHVVLLTSAHAERDAANAEQLNQAGGMLAECLYEMGYTVEREVFTLPDGPEVFNVVAEVPGTAQGTVVIGAHYDVAAGTPGADDNASGVAGVLELARRFRETTGRFGRTLRFVFFTTEEPPHYRMDTMGSLVHARASRARGDDIVAMIAVEMIGYFDDDPGSQRYPAMPGVKAAAGLPDVGDFIGVVTRRNDQGLLKAVVSEMDTDDRLPVVSLALPETISGVGWSDHWSFWQAGYPAVMVTDTAFARNPNYHQPTDTYDTLDYDRMALVVDAIERATTHLLGPTQTGP